MASSGKRTRETQGRKSTIRASRRPGINPPAVPVLPMFPKLEELTTHTRLCQCLVAFGVGAGPIRVSGSAVLWFYARLWPYFRSLSHHPTRRHGWLDASDWDGTHGKLEDYRNEAPQVLDLARSCGRYAAWYATAAGCFTINTIHVKRAMAKFGKYKPGTRAGRAESRGAYCMPEPPSQRTRSSSAKPKPRDR